MYAQDWHYQPPRPGYYPPVPGAYPQAPPAYQPPSQTYQPAVPAQPTIWSSAQLISIADLHRSRFSIPASEANNFRTASQEAVDKCTDVNALHVYHVVGSRDELLLLGAVLMRLKIEEKKNNRGPVLMIIVEQLKDQTTDDGDRVKNVMDILTQTLGKPLTKMSDRVQTCDDVVLIINRAGAAPDSTETARYQAWHKEEMGTIEATISAIKGLGQKTGKKGTVWHNGTWLPLLTYILEREARFTAECSFTAITINGAFDIPSATSSDPFAPSANVSLPHASHLAAITAATKKLSIPLVLLSPTTLSLDTTLQFLHTLPSFASSIHLHLPSGSYLPTFKTTFNNLAIAIFRLRASLYGYTGSTVSEFAKKALAPIKGSAKHWAEGVLRSRSYDKTACSHDAMFGEGDGTGTLTVASWFCNLPLLDWNTAVHGLVVSPGVTAELKNSVVALRSACDFSEPLDVRLHAQGTTYILTPRTTGSVETALKSYWSSYNTAVRRSRTSASKDAWGSDEKSQDEGINKGVAKAWIDLRGVLEAQIEAVVKDGRTKGRGQKEKDVVDGCRKGLREGGMTRVCKNSLG